MNLAGKWHSDRMKILILSHSSSGNTSLVTRFAERRLARAGHEIMAVKLPAAPPDPTPFDMVGVFSPTMYFRPMVAVEAWLERLPDRSEARIPAFLVATCAGEPGAHFELQAAQLARKGLRVFAAHWLPMPSNWPPHRVLSAKMEPALPLGRLLCRGPLRPLRVALGFLWTELTEPDERDRREFEEFLEMLPKEAAAACPDVSRLYSAWLPGAKALGHRMTTREMRKATAVHIDPSPCKRCGSCAKACPSGTITWPEREQPPVMGAGCTGCWACYNACPHGAIAGWMSPPGKGRYPGPSRETCALFNH